jgi:hypothetical protein
LVRGRVGVQRITRFARFAFAASVVGAVFLGAHRAKPGAEEGFTLVTPARAQSEAELSAARQLFADALADEQAGRHAAALDKFQRVQAVRDTQAVRYRIATCLEALGGLKAALAAYTSASIAGAGGAESAGIARASRDKVDALSKRVARVTVTLPARAPADAVVKIDAETVPANMVGTPIVVDPGAHEVTVTAAGSVPFHSRVTLAEGAQGTVEATFTPAPPVAPPSPPPAALPSQPGGAPEATPPSAPEAVPGPTPPPPGSSRKTAGTLLVAGGGALVVAGTVILLLRHSDIQSLDAACPNGVCPRSRQSELQATHDRAVVEGPLGVGLGAAGIVAAGIGVYFLVRPAHTSQAASSVIAPWADRSSAGVAWSGTF